MTKSILMYVSPKEALNVLKQAVRDNWDDEAVTDDLEPEFTCLENRLILAEKEHELLELYRKLSKELNLEIVIGCDSWDGIYSFETLECQVDDLSIETFKQVQQLEEELKVKE